MLTLVSIFSVLDFYIINYKFLNYSYVSSTISREKFLSIQILILSGHGIVIAHRKNGNTPISPIPQ